MTIINVEAPKRPRGLYPYSFNDWTFRDDDLAHRDGWGMRRELAGRLTITEYPTTSYEREGEMRLHVLWEAMCGSRLHIKAWLLHARSKTLTDSYTMIVYERYMQAMTLEDRLIWFRLLTRVGKRMGPRTRVAAFVFSWRHL